MVTPFFCIFILQSIPELCQNRAILARSRHQSYEIINTSSKRGYCFTPKYIQCNTLYLRRDFDSDHISLFKTEMASPDGSSDFRLEYIGAFVQKSLKLKPEKWGRLLLTEEYRNAVHDFLDNPLPAALFVALTPNAQLVACTSFPVPCQRTKGENDETKQILYLVDMILKYRLSGIYAVKVEKTPLPKDEEACSSMLILGDLSSRVVDQLATLVDNIFAPLLSKAENHKDLPDVAIQDICRHVHSLRGTLYQVNFLFSPFFERESAECQYIFTALDRLIDQRFAYARLQKIRE